ncbi:MAG: ABC transporter ATP-binding protein [Erysipelothrix sp.]
MKTLLLNNKKGFFLYFLGIIITAPSNLLISYALAQIFTIPESDNPFLKLLLIVCLALTPILIGVISRMLRIGYMNDVLYDLRTESYQNIVTQDIDSFHTQENSYYHSKLVSDIKIFEQDYFLSLLRMGNNFSSYIVGVAVLFYLSWELGVIILIGTLIIFGLSQYFTKETIRRKKIVTEQNKLSFNAINNLIYGLRSIQIFGAQVQFKMLFNQDIKQLEAHKANSNDWDFFQKNILTVTSSGIHFLSFIFATYLLAQERISLVSTIMVMNLLSQLLWNVSDGFSFVNKFKASLKIYDSLMDHPKPIHRNETYTFDNLICLENVSFNYEDKAIFKNLNSRIHKNDKVFIIGPSGSGKSTLLNIMAGHTNNYTGNVLIDGVALNDISYNSRFENTSYVTQDHYFFNESIRDNIILDAPFDQDRYKCVLKQCALTSWIESLEEKDAHLLTDNAHNISGGQKQRIHIARELYQNKPVIILDEMTASLDEDNAYVIYETLLNLDKTVIFTSHRHHQYLKERSDQIIDLGGYCYEN